VSNIASYAFSNCSVLTSINVDNENSKFSSDNGVLFNKNKTTLICYPFGKSASNYVVPNDVTTIGEGAFFYCSALISIDLPSGLKSIGAYSFGSCSSLVSIDIPISVTGINAGVFHSCSNLSSINVENENTKYFSEDGVLYNKEKTTIVRYPEGKTGNSYVIPNSVTTIGENAFYNCFALITVTIPNSVKTIKKGAFSGCTALFSLVIPNTVTTIEDWAFVACTSLTSINIPDGITTIGGFVFADCQALTSIIIPSSVKTIKNNAFNGCASLTSLTNLNPIPVAISSNLLIFSGVNVSACTLTVPTSAVSAYQNAEIWQNFNIVGGGLLVYPKSNNKNYGYATGNALYAANATATVTATALNDYQFVNWTKDGIEVSRDISYSFTVTEDVELVANFEKITGIETLETDGIKIYPNPTTGELRIINNYELKIKNIEIFDVLGRVVFTRHCGLDPQSPAITADISHLPAGIYLVRAVMSDGGIRTGKVVLR
jgi:hypothetical protein